MKISPFQIYSQKENTVTNNFLLMLRWLYDIKPFYYESFINGFIEDENRFISVSPAFIQQHGKGEGIVDGFIESQAFTIVLETKLNRLENSSKLSKYVDRFPELGNNILLHLSKSKFNNEQLDEIAGIDALLKKNILVISLTYEDTLDALRQLLETALYDQSLSVLVDDFANYLTSSSLLPRKNILRVMACNASFNLNKEYAMYFDKAERGFSDFNYLGIYKNKSVHYIGKTEFELVVTHSENGEPIFSSKTKITTDQRLRAISTIKVCANTWPKVMNNHRFFFFEKEGDNGFSKTNFEKNTAYGIQRSKFFNLKSYFNKHLNLEIDESTSVSYIAEKLNGRVWHPDL